MYLDDEYSFAQSEGHFQYRQFIFRDHPAKKEFVISSSLLSGDKMYKYVDAKKRKKESAGPVDITGRIENITVHGVLAHASITKIYVNYSKEIRFSHSSENLVIKLPLVKIEEDWDIIVHYEPQLKGSVA